MGTLADYYADQNGIGRVKTLGDNLAQAKTNATIVRDEANKAQTTFDEAVRNINELVARVAQVRRLLPTAPTRPDGDELMDELDFLLGEVGAAHRARVSADGDRIQATTESDLAGRALNRLAAAKIAADAASTEAKATAEKRASLNAQIGDPAFQTVLNKVNAAKADDATNRVGTAVKDGELPKELIAQALTIRQTALDARTKATGDAEAARTASLTASTAQTGSTGVVDKARDARDRADAALRRYATSAASEIDRITTALARIADASIDPLSKAEHDAIFDTNLKASRSAALTAETKFLAGTEAHAMAVAQTKLEQAKLALANAAPNDPNIANLQKAVDDATTELNTATNAAKAVSDPFVGLRAALLTARDTRDAAFKTWSDSRAKAASSGAAVPDDDPAVKQAKQDLDTAVSEYRTAKDNEQQSAGGILRIWRAAVPAAAWQRLFDLEDLKIALQDLKDTNPSDLSNAARDADVLLAKAVQAADAAADDLITKQDAEIRTAAAAAVTGANGLDRPNP